MRDSGRSIRKRERGWIEEGYREETGQSGNSQRCPVISRPSSKEKQKRLILAGWGGVGGDDVSKG